MVAPCLLSVSSATSIFAGSACSTGSHGSASTSLAWRSASNSSFRAAEARRSFASSAANASALLKSHDCKLILIAPAFGLYDSLLERLTEEEITSWERLDSRRYVGFEHDIVLPWSYMEQAKEMSWTLPYHKTSIIHGISDDIVPIESSRKICKMGGHIDLYEIEDNHRMKKSVELLEVVASSLMSS